MKRPTLLDFTRFEPVARLALIRIFAPLFALGFMSSRLAHVGEWLGAQGFRVPDLGAEDYRQPLHLPALPGDAPLALGAAMVISGLMLSAGFRTRLAGAVFALSIAYAALADRLSAFTVSKIAPAIALALCVSEAGQALSVDAWLLDKRGAPARSSLVAPGSIRFFQLLIVVFYTGSGVCKIRGDWLSHDDVLWTHLHDSYQTGFSFLVAKTLPAFAWPALQWMVLALETGAPLWFGFARTRPFALAIAVTMHAFIGLAFGPVRWFSLLMITLLIASFLPASAFKRLENG